MNKKIVLTIIILHFLIGNSFGRKDFRNGFIITLKHDTIRGQVKYRSNSKNYESCIFKSGEGEAVYYPNQILGFGYVNDKHFTSQLTKNSFSEELVTGKMSLYRSKGKYLIKKDTTLYDFELVAEQVVTDRKTGMNNNKRWKGLLTYLIGDCLDNPGNIASRINLDEKSLTQLIVAYNKCSGKEFTENKVSKPWTKFEFGSSLGITKSEILIANKSQTFSYLSDSYRSVNPSIGLVVAISSPRIAERIAFQSEVHFIKSAYSSLVELNDVSTSYHDTYINLSTLSVPLSLKYSFPEKKCGWYLQGGLNYDYHLNSDTRLLSEYVYGHVVNTIEEQAFKIRNNQIGYWGGVGVLKSYRKFKGSISIRYFQLPAFNKTEGFFSNNNHISLNRISFNLILFK